MAQVCRLGPRVGGRLALFCIHRVNRLYGALVMDILRRLINCRIIIIIIITSQLVSQGSTIVMCIWSDVNRKFHGC